MKTTTKFQLSKEHTEKISEVIKKYFSEELELEIGNLQTELFIEFLNEHVGEHYYNLGVTDAISVIKEKADDLVLLIKV